MNILYLYSNEINPTRGGVQRVTFVLSEYFRKQGHKVVYLGLHQSESPFQFTFPDLNNAISQQNLKFLIEFIKAEHIDITVFQEGISSLHTDWLDAVKQTNSKLISCIHNSLLGGIVNMELSAKDRLQKYHLTPLVHLLKFPFIPSLVTWGYRKIMHLHYQKLCNISDKVVLLSNKFQQELNLFIDVNRYNNITAIPNPVSFNSTTIAPKKNKILYVGRIDTKHKRTDLLVQIWEKVWQKFPNWTLDIVGDGAELPSIKNYVEKKSIKNIYFHGFQNPSPFYQEASIFCMTSSSEGFGIVLIEAMQNGAVPIAFNSYPSVTDIITDGRDGILVSPMNIDEYADKLSQLIINDKLRNQITSKCIQKSKCFSIEKIGERWINLFQDLTKSNNPTINNIKNEKL